MRQSALLAASVVLALGCFLLQGLPLLSGQSATMDEVAHIGAAMSTSLGGERLNPRARLRYHKKQRARLASGYVTLLMSLHIWRTLHVF